MSKVLTSADSSVQSIEDDGGSLPSEMRLLVLSDQYMSFVKDQVELLSPHFAEITVIVRHNPVTEISRFFPLHSLAPFRRDTLVDLRSVPPNVRVLFAPALYLPFDSDNRRQGDRLLRSIRRVIQHEHLSFDLIHAHFVWPNGHVAVRLGEEFGVPVVITAHGYDIYDLPFRDDAWRRLISDALTRADRVIAVSKSTRCCAVEVAPGIEPVIIPNGYRPEIFRPLETELCRRQLDLPLDRTIVLTAGGFVPEKGQRYLIEAASILEARGEDIFWILMGMGRLHDDLVDRIRRLRVEDRFSLPGWADHAVMPIWMNACDLFVLPSISESFGLVQIEAMACGKPVVATINGGSEEIVASPDVGILVPPADAEALAEAITQGLHRPWSSETIGSYAEKYRWEFGIESLMRLYADLLRRREPSKKISWDDRCVI